MRLVTVDSAEVVAKAEAELTPHCYLAHEIGAGHWYGYLWGPVVARYLSLASGPHMVASCLHADTIEELQADLASLPLGVSPSVLLGIDFVLFMRVDRGGAGEAGGYRRRVAAVYQSNRSGGSHRRVFRWERERDAFECTGQFSTAGEMLALARQLKSLAATGPLSLAGFRDAYLLLLR